MNVDTSYLTPKQREKARKRAEGEARLAIWTAKSPTEQLAYLDNLFGKGKGASKQRAKLAKKLAK